MNLKENIEASKRVHSSSTEKRGEKEY